MSAKNTGPASDFEALARQYWNAWSDFAQPSSTGPAAAPGFKDGLAWWSQLAGQGREGVDAALERMNAQAGSWFGTMQQLAAGFAGRDSSPGEIGKAWSEMLGGSAGNPVAEMFRRMSGADAHGVESWMAQAAPMLGVLRGETGSLLNLPAFGSAREHQERLQRLAQAQVAYQERINGYNEQLARAGKLAFERFERKLGEHSEPGRQIDSARALFDLWIDAAEEAWSEVAITPDYRRAYGELINSQMRMRAAVQREIELAAGSFGLPTRSEVNASHRKLAALEREVRALRTQLANVAASTPRPASTTAAASRSEVPTVAPKPGPKPKAKAKPKLKPKPEPASRAAAAPRARATSRPRAGAARTKPAARTKMLPQVVAPRAVGRAMPSKKQPARSAGTSAKKAR